MRLFLAAAAGAAATLAVQMVLKIVKRKQLAAAAAGGIVASGASDPGLKDVLGHTASELAKVGQSEMANLVDVQNTGIVPTYYADHPATKMLVSISTGWPDLSKTASGVPTPRNFVLIVEDMQVEYTQYVDYVLPNAEKLVTLFRELGLPIVWTNWSRTADDGCYGALDRFYGPRGVGEKVNPCYLHMEGGNTTVPSLAPVNDDERSRMIKSMHLDKFSDLDANGREILYPMLKAWGVDTIVLMGAWTDDCIAATTFRAADALGFDVVLVTDALATATIHGHKMVECLSGAVCTPKKADEVVAHIKAHPGLVKRPEAPLVGSVYLSDVPLVATRC